MSKKNIRKIIGQLIIWSIFTASISYASVPIVTVYEKVTSSQVAPGLVYEHKEKLTEDGWVDIHVMKIDLRDESLDLDIVRNNGVFGSKSGLSDMTNQDERFVGAINGAFFSTKLLQSDTIGVEIRNNDIGILKNQYNLEKNGAVSLCLSETSGPFIDFVDTEIVMTTARGKRVYLQGVNTIGTDDGVTIYNRNAYETTALIDASRKTYKIVVEDGVVTNIAPPSEIVTIPENGYVVVFPEDQGQVANSLFFTGMYVTLSIRSDVNVDDLELAISGGGMILEDGIVVEKGLIIDSNRRHPRTAIGLSQDKETLITMVVDGRGRSIGATHSELASYLLEYQVYEAMHTDGGGSSTMVTRNLGNFDVDTKNTPSDGRERSIINGLGFVSTAETTEEYGIYLEADQKRVFINNKVNMTLVGYDQNFNPVEIDMSQVAWGMAGGYGIMKDNTFTPKEAGQVVLTAYYKGHLAEQKLTIVDELIDLEIIPKTIHFNDGIKQFKVIGTDTNGYKTVLDNSMLDWSIDKAIGTIDGGIFIGTDPTSMGKIQVKYKQVKENAYVMVDEIIKPLLDLEEATVTTLLYPKIVDGKAEIDKSTLNIDYKFQASEVAQAVYAIFDQVVIEHPINQLSLKISVIDKDVSIKAHLLDVFDEQYTITFEPNSNNTMVASIPASLSYPIKFKRLYVVANSLQEEKVSSVSISDIASITHKDILDSTKIKEYAPIDELYNQTPSEGYEISVFGASSGRNRLLDEVVMNKVYEKMNEGDYSIYAGESDVESQSITNNYTSYDDKFRIIDLDAARVVTLGMSTGSLVRTDSSQWDKLESALSSSLQKTIIIIGTETLVDNTDQKFVNEGWLIHNVLSEFVEKSGKKIFYVNASGYEYHLGLYEGIRYIDLNGLWYQISDKHSVNLYDSFRILNFHFSNGDVSYRVEDLYPKIVTK